MILVSIPSYSDNFQFILRCFMKHEKSRVLKVVFENDRLETRYLVGITKQIGKQEERRGIMIT